MSAPSVPVTPNPWQALRRFTDARIALGRAGVSQPTAPHLAFQLAHAQARDAVHLALDVPALRIALNDVAAAFAPGVGDDMLGLHSAAGDRHTYLQRPDLGRRLAPASRLALEQAVETSAVAQGADGRRFDLAFVLADGLSALAVAQHAAPLLEQVFSRLDPQAWSLAPWVIALQGRVALADEIGEVLGARTVVMLIGERPGLSSPDSLGLYMTWMPRVGLTDADRNCISNIRPAGLSYRDAAHKLHYLLEQARQLRLSGVALKDETEHLQAAVNGASGSHEALTRD